MGMMMSLGVLWMLTERLHRTKNLEEKSHLTVIGVLRKIDSASVLFFLGILLAVASLQEAGHLLLAADWLRTSLNDVYLIDLVPGLLSAIVDNVPLVAASMGVRHCACRGGHRRLGSHVCAGWHFGSSWPTAPEQVDLR